jgi:hypothetical protein
MYPGGLPIQKQSINFGNKKFHEIELAYYQHTANEDEINFLKDFTIYYIFAPIFYSEYTSELREKINPEMELDEILDLALEYGLDVL